MEDVDRIVERYFEVFNPNRLTKEQIEKIKEEVKKQVSEK